jgi:hypothetical protein
MEPRLTRSVEIPERRGRPLLAAAAIAVLFATGAHNYMMTARARDATRAVQLSFATSPPGADVIRERDGALLCRTPCMVVHEVGRFGVTGFRFRLDGHDDRRVLVNLAGGDTHVEAVLAPQGSSHAGRR